METLNNFASIYCYIAFVIGAVFMLAMLSIAAMSKSKEPRNKVHFYVARNENGDLWLFIDNPYRDINKFCDYKYKGGIAISCSLKIFGLNEDDYKNLRCEDEPVEVFLNMED